MATKRELWLWGGLGAVAVLYALSRTDKGAAALASATDAGGATVSSVHKAISDAFTPRGIRDNNPGNIMRSGIRWQGSLSIDELNALGKSFDSTFEQFATPADGVRAIGHVLRSYAARGLSSVADIISNYSATDQAAYIGNVASALGVEPGATIDVSARLPELAAAIIRQENGEQPYDPNDLAQWVYA